MDYCGDDEEDITAHAMHMVLTLKIENVHAAILLLKNRCGVMDSRDFLTTFAVASILVSDNKTFEEIIRIFKQRHLPLGQTLARFAEELVTTHSLYDTIKSLFY